MNVGMNVKQASSRLTARRHFDILSVPGLRQVLLWKHSRTAIQIVTFTLAVIMVIDGLTGNQLAARNSATDMLSPPNFPVASSESMRPRKAFRTVVGCSKISLSM